MSKILYAGMWLSTETHINLKTTTKFCIIYDYGFKFNEKNNDVFRIFNVYHIHINKKVLMIVLQ